MAPQDQIPCEQTRRTPIPSFHRVRAVPRRGGGRCRGLAAVLLGLLLATGLAAGAGPLSSREAQARDALTWQASGLRPVEQRLLAAASAYSESHNGVALVVVNNGQRVFESYASASDRDTPRELASGTKSFWGVAAVAAAADGILSLDEPVAETLTEWSGDSRKRTITVRQLLNFTSGLPPGNRELHGASDLYQAALNLDLAAAPGTLFTYGPSHLGVFGAFLARKLGGRERPLDYLKRRVLNPIGLVVGDWRTDGQGHAILAAGASLTAREWVKFGQLLVNGGAWEGRQIIPAAFIQELTRPSTVNPRYGLTFWLANAMPPGAEARIKGIRDVADLDFSGVPGDMFMAAGKGDHRLYMIPSLRLVVARLSSGRDRNWDDGAFLRLLLTGSQ